MRLLRHLKLAVDRFNKNLCGRDGRTICGPQGVPKSTSVTLAVDEKTLPMATITGRTDGQTDRRTDSATQYAAPAPLEGRIINAYISRL